WAGPVRVLASVARRIVRFGERRRVRVKRCGKSAPRPWQHGWQAKPRTEQDQIGKRSRTARPKLPGRSLDPASNGGTRGMIVAAPDPQRPGRNRIRLMACCEHSTCGCYLDVSRAACETAS